MVLSGPSDLTSRKREMYLHRSNFMFIRNKYLVLYMKFTETFRTGSVLAE